MSDARVLSEAGCVVIFGGSFDPPHRGHIELPRLAMEAVGADVVAFVPAAVSPFKTDRPPTSAAHRVAMLRIALAGRRWAVVLTDEIDRAAANPGEPSYMVDTVEALRSRVGESVSLRLLLGEDQLPQLHRWRRVERLLALAPPVVMARRPTGDGAEKSARLRAEVDGRIDDGKWAQRLVTVRTMAVSSTEIRRKLAAGESADALLPAGVGAYIRERGLYGWSGEGSAADGADG